MTDLSPAAQAVLDAVPPHPIHEQALAAALRAAADQASYCLDGSNYYVAAKDDLLAIANELEQLDA